MKKSNFCVMFALIVFMIITGGCTLLFDTYTVEGRIIDGRDETEESGVDGISISFYGTGAHSASVTTDAYGYFKFHYLRGTGTIQPYGMDWEFEPESITVDGEANIEFVAYPIDRD